MAEEGKQQTNDEDEKLGEGGLRALQAERESNKELRASLKQLQEDIKKRDDEKLSKEEQLEKRALDAENLVKELETKESQRQLRSKIAEDHDVPGELLSGSTEEELKASAERLKTYLEEATGPRKPEPNPYLGQDSSESGDAESNARQVLGF